VFGCGGDRDSSKRALMGEVVSRLADQGIVTSDNPRSENPEAIISQILSGMKQDKTAVIADRKSAILYAIHHAEAGDVILLAGKGHENYQEIQGNKIPFSDSDEAARALQERAQHFTGRLS
jgi:UDP-N-acetylmuramoyl-L-alanyl-D-glutamate--2,6-diaminopimelate ligase